MTLTRTAHTSRANRRSRRLARAAGWLSVAFGAVHTVVAPLENRHIWADILGQGPWKTISLDLTSENLAYSQTFWVSAGSFGVPVLLFGALVLWTDRQGARVPAPFGWAMIAWGSALAALLPTSPAWALLLVGGLLVTSARAAGPAEDGATAGDVRTTAEGQPPAAQRTR